MPKRRLSPIPTYTRAPKRYISKPKLGPLAVQHRLSCIVIRLSCSVPNEGRSSCFGRSRRARARPVYLAHLPVADSCADERPTSGLLGWLHHWLRFCWPRWWLFNLCSWYQWCLRLDYHYGAWPRGEPGLVLSLWWHSRCLRPKGRRQLSCLCPRLLFHCF